MFSVGDSTSHVDSVPLNVCVSRTSSSIDIEDILSVDADAAYLLCPPLLSYRSHHCLGVTTLAAQLWCEHQTHLALTLGPRITQQQQQVMEAGTTHHEALERELHTIIPVTVYSREEEWALKLLNAIMSIQELKHTGTTRELLVIGRINTQRWSDKTYIHTWVIGVIDEVQRSSQAGEWRLLDHKTRFRRRLPSIAQQRTSRFQLSLYKQLFDSLISNKKEGDETCSEQAVSPSIQYSFTAFSADQLVKELDMEGSTAFNTDFQQHLVACHLDRDTTLLALIQRYLTAFLTLESTSSNQLQINYTYQLDGSSLGSSIFDFDSVCFPADLCWLLLYWTGDRQSEAVLQHEAWKCERCEYLQECNKTPITNKQAILTRRQTQETKEKEQTPDTMPTPAKRQKSETHNTEMIVVEEEEKEDGKPCSSQHSPSPIQLSVE